MVILFIDQRTDAQHQQGIPRAEQMKRQRRQMAVQHDDAEILNIAINGVEQEDPLNGRGIAIHRIEDRGHIHQQQRKNIIQIAGVPEENKHGGEDHAHADIEHNQASDWVEQQKEGPTEWNPIDRHKEKEHD